MLKCKYCNSTNVTVQAVEQQKKRGIIMSIIWILLALCTCGIALLIPILTKKGSKTKSVIVCQDCGKITKI
jgi:hypothetical protein